LLDKRALHLGGGGTHRLGLGDAILIKTNHLALASAAAASGIETPLRQAWERRGGAAFFEVEVTNREEALGAARVLRDLQGGEADSCPCLVMLENFSPAEAARTVAALAGAGLLENVLVEASGRVSQPLAEAYAASGVDAISIGALTHSAKALDLSAQVVPGRSERR
jgi:nicotinate-nucleotide pyrophosphorylase (carboxylating)